MCKARIQVGTSGYSYTEWREAGFYPKDTKTPEMLSIYSSTFPITELNYTWYQMPKAAAMERMIHNAPTDFCFAAKLTRTMTHEVNPDQWRSQVSQYREGISPLLQSRQLAALLVQLPPGFDRTPKNRLYLAKLLDELAGLPIAVEFRHISWATDSVFEELQHREVTLVAVDRPDLPWLFPRLDVVTNHDLFYIRFHGQNAKGWRSGNMQKQFDYDYSNDELNQWIEDIIKKMAGQARKGVIFFNNHVRGQAPKNASTLIGQLIEHGMMENKSWSDS